MERARKRYVGLDVHKDVVEYCILDAAGKKIDGGRIVCEQSVQVILKPKRIRKPPSEPSCKDRKSHRRWRISILLSVTMIWSREFFKITGKDHQCRRIASSVPQKTAGRAHEERDGGASGHRAVTGSGQAASVNFCNKRLSEMKTGFTDTENK